jgi:hypothetical protein
MSIPMAVGDASLGQGLYLTHRFSLRDFYFRLQRGPFHRSSSLGVPPKPSGTLSWGFYLWSGAFLDDSIIYWRGKFLSSGGSSCKNQLKSRVFCQRIKSVITALLTLFPYAHFMDSA